MDMIGDFNLLIAAAFGRYIKYHVRSETLSTDINVTVNETFNEIHSNT